MRFLIAGESDYGNFGVETCVCFVENGLYDVVGIVHKNWHVYGTASDDQIDDRVIKYYSTNLLFDQDFDALFIVCDNESGSNPENNEKFFQEFLDKVKECTYVDLSTKPLFTISAFPENSKVVRVGSSLIDMRNKMEDPSKRQSKR